MPFLLFLLQASTLYGTYLTRSLTFKVWPLDAPVETNWPWRWPFADVFLYQIRVSQNKDSR